MNSKGSTWSGRAAGLAAAALMLSLAGCSSSPAAKPGPDAGRDAATPDAARDAGDPDDHPVKTCSDPQPWTAPAAPAACADVPPAAPTTAAAATLTVDVSAVVRPWNRFYEKTVASDHAHTVLCTAYGRNIQNALRKAHAQAGFQYVRFHALFDDDDAVYSEDPAGGPLYDWSSIDAIEDAILAAGMRPLVEVSFTPAALASDPTATLDLLWYNYASPNISPPATVDPTTGASDWSKWTALMTAFVTHLEERYGAAEVRAWYFEIWNEPSWMYSLGDNGYFELYKNTVAGLVAADPQVRVGGPAGSSGESAGTIQQLVTGSTNSHTKLDFLTYHRYGDDNGGAIADVAGAVAFHDSLMTTVAGTAFTGPVFNDEFGPSYKPDISRDNEVGASYIAKVVTLLGNDTTTAPPASYGYWAVSDLYEEIPTGNATAYRPGNFGLLLKGDPKIAESYDVAKPAFNAFRLLHMMGDQQLSVTGGATGDGVGGAATITTDGSAVQVLVYNHVTGGAADATQSTVVAMTLNHLPFTGAVRIRQYAVDSAHANSYRAWLAMGSPPNPTEAQWVTLRDAAELCYHETTAQPTAGSYTFQYAQGVYGVDLFQITAAPPPG